MYCYHYKLLPSNFDNYFCQGISIHKYNARYSCHYRSYPARTKVMQFSVKCSGPKVWNTLPQELIQAPTLSLFKTKLKHYCCVGNDGHDSTPTTGVRWRRVPTQPAEYLCLPLNR